MVAEFERPLNHYGAWFYPRLFWEAGAVGQVLYLEAEAAGIRSTGIGCYFDDAMHEILGLEDTTYQGPVPLHSRRCGRRHSAYHAPGLCGFTIIRSPGHSPSASFDHNPTGVDPGPAAGWQGVQCD